MDWMIEKREDCSMRRESVVRLIYAAGWKAFCSRYLQWVFLMSRRCLDLDCGLDRDIDVPA